MNDGEASEDEVGDQASGDEVLPEQTSNKLVKDDGSLLVRLLPYNTIGIILVACLLKYEHVHFLFTDYIPGLIKPYVEPYFPVHYLLPGILVAFLILSLFSRLIGKIEDILKKNSERKRIVSLERDVLVKLYKQTDGDNWKKSKNWLSDKPLREWHGVKVDDKTGRIRKLILAHNNLSGALPYSIGDLINVDEIDLRHNNLTGEVPESIGNLHRLEGLYLHDNFLTGKIPVDALIGLRAMLGVYLYNNDGMLDKSEAFEKLEKGLPEGCLLYI